MEDGVSQLRLAAIVAIDMVGYSSRAAVHEQSAVAAVAALAQRVEAACARFGGRVFNTAGDGFMAEFPTVSGALQAAEALARSAEVPLRIGVHLGEVHVSSTGDLLGHGVNVAARLQERASPGSLLISGDVRRAARGLQTQNLVDRGVVRLEGLNEAMPVFALRVAEAAKPDGGRWRRLARPAVLAACAAAVLILAGGLAVSRLAGGRPREVALAPVQAMTGDPAARRLASELTDGVAGSIADGGLRVIAPGADRRAYALVLSGRIESSGRDLTLTAALEDPREHAMIWSARFAGDEGKPGAIGEQATAKIAAVMRCAVDATGLRPRPLTSETLQLYLRACDVGQADPGLDQVRELLREVAQRRPDFSRAWSRLAYTAANAAFLMQPAQAGAARREARLAARRALKIDPKDGLAYEALADAGLGELSWADIYRLFERGLAAEPANADAIEDESQLLLRAGRIRDAIQLAQRCVALNPYSPSKRQTLIDALADGGRIGEARAELAQAIRRWPQDQRFIIGRVALEARSGDPAAARSMLDDPAMAGGVSDAVLAGLKRLVQARMSGPHAVRSYVRDEVADFEAGRLAADDAVLDLADVEALPEVFRIAGTVRNTAPASPPGGGFDPEVLWRSYAEPVRRDRRFMAIAARLGLVDFWRATGMWPDFCSAPARPYDCSAAGAEALAGLRRGVERPAPVG